MRSITILFILCLLTSCSKKKPEQVIEAIDVAQTYLSESKCADAIEILEDVGRQNENAIYLQVLASAYACRAGYSEIDFIINDVGSIDTSPSSDLMKSLSILALSDETTTDSDAYEDLLLAMNILLEADGGVQPSQVTRQETFGVRKAGDMGMQVLFMTIVQLGKFLNHYGDVDATGAKSLGTTGTNTCFLDYPYANAQAVVASLPASNSCQTFTAGHDDLDLTVAAGRRRVCEGLVLITNLIDVLNNIDLSENDTLSSLENVATVANSFKTTAIAADPDLETLLETTSQSECETLLETASEVENMQIIYALIFESGLE